MNTTLANAKVGDLKHPEFGYAKKVADHFAEIYPPLNARIRDRYKPSPIAHPGLWHDPNWQPMMPVPELKQLTSLMVKGGQTALVIQDGRPSIEHPEFASHYPNSLVALLPDTFAADLAAYLPSEQETAKTKRVVFELDERSYASLEDLKQTTGCNFRVIMVRDPKTHEDREIVLPVLP